MSNLLGAIQKNRESLLQDWLKRLRSAVQRRDLITDQQLEAQASEMISTIVDVPVGTTLDDGDGAGWQPLKAMLANLSVSRATLGFTPSETAAFVLSLKPALFALARQQRSANVDELFSEVLMVNNFVDNL